MEKNFGESIPLNNDNTVDGVANNSAAVGR